MATDLRQLPAYLGDDATFRTWGSGIAAQLAAVGLVQASDTGQINWASVVRPGAINTFAGYEVWRFNDSLQATKPVFVKVEYGVAGAVDRPNLRVTASTATNGAGTPGGQVGAAVVTPALASKGAGVTLPSYCSGTAARLNLISNLDVATPGFSFRVFAERTKVATGEDTGDGIVTFHSSTTTPRFQVVPFSGAIPLAATDGMAASLTSAGVSSVGPNIALSPTIAPLGRAYFASWCAYLHADLGQLQPFAADHLGASHTFMPFGNGINTSNLVQGSSASHSLAMLWE